MLQSLIQYLIHDTDRHTSS